MFKPKAQKKRSKDDSNLDADLRTTSFSRPEIEDSHLNESHSANESDPDSQNGVVMKRSLSLWNGVSIIVGVIIGSGIFLTPGSVLDKSGSTGMSLVVWALCGLFALLGALCFAELGTSIQGSGGDYTYIRLAYGPLAGFLYIWVMVLIILPCANAIAALTFAKYCLQPIYTDCVPPENAVRLLSLVVMLLLVYLNCISVKGSISLQNVSTIAKVLALFIVIGSGFYQLTGDNGSRSTKFIDLWTGTETNFSRLAAAFYHGFYTYSGWNSLNCVTEEIKDPKKNIPRALIISLTGITLIYILTNGAFFVVLSKDQILKSEAIGVQFGDQLLGSGLTHWLMPAVVSISVVGGLNGAIFAASRVLYAGARQGQLFSALQMIHHKKLTPIPSLLFLGLISCLYLVTTEITALIEYLVFVEAAFAALAVSTVIALRIKHPKLARPLRIPTIIPIIYLIFSFLLVFIPVLESPNKAVIGLAITLTGIPAYLITARWQNKPPAYQKSLDRFNSLAQLLTFSLAPTSLDLAAQLAAE